jgi:hypothetical protein
LEFKLDVEICYIWSRMISYMKIMKLTMMMIIRADMIQSWSGTGKPMRMGKTHEEDDNTDINIYMLYS